MWAGKRALPVGAVSAPSGRSPKPQQTVAKGGLRSFPASRLRRARLGPRRRARARAAAHRSRAALRRSPGQGTRTTPPSPLGRSELIGRPLGDDAFLDAISRRLIRAVTPRKRGRKPKGDVAAAEAKG